MTNQIGFMCSRGLPQISKKAWAPPANHCSVTPLPQWPLSTAETQVSCWWVGPWSTDLWRWSSLQKWNGLHAGSSETNLVQILFVTCILTQSYKTMKCTWLPLRLFLCPSWLTFLFGYNLQQCELQSSSNLHFLVLAEYEYMPYSQLCFCMIIYCTMTSQANIILPHACLWLTLTVSNRLVGSSLLLISFRHSEGIATLPNWYVL